MARFTAANAREMAAKSIAARQAAKIEREHSPASAPVQAVSDGEVPLEINVSCVRARLETLDRLMAKAKDDKQWDAYSRAYERMFRVWCTLTKTPGPGNLKPSSRPPTQSRRTISPVGVDTTSEC